MDLNGMNSDALELIKAYEPNSNSVEEAVPDGPWAIIQHKTKVYCIRYDGVCHVLTDNSPLRVTYYLKFNNGAIWPEDVMYFDLNEQEVLKLPIEKRQLLSTFIIEFGEIPEVFYNKIVEVLDNQEDPLIFSTKDQLKKVSPFLKKDWCECNKNVILVTCREYSCPCKVKRKHVHCKGCGGIIKMIT